ncbi:MAG: transglycosylase family protein [Actinomycetota bacterium]|nr:transglycosylase family protein [Actinomycetota bacterium]
MRPTLRSLFLALAALVAIFVLGACQPTPEQIAAFQEMNGLTAAASEQDLAELRHCESTGRYDISSSNGLYHGAYQFSQRTWDDVASRWMPWLVGRSPANVTPHEQDAMARALLLEAGPQPWPHCGARAFSN